MNICFGIQIEFPASKQVSYARAKAVPDICICGGNMRVVFIFLWYLRHCFAVIGGIVIFNSFAACVYYVQNKI